MRIAIMSDLHLEFSKWRPPEIDADLIIIAGDTHPGLLGIEWANFHFKKQPVIMIAGNHEFYGKRSINRHPLKMKAKAEEFGTNVKFLHNEVFEMDGYRFACSTLWTDYRLEGNQPISMFRAETLLNDFNYCVYNYHEKLRAQHVLDEHIIARKFLEDSVDEKTIVVTHHAPSEQSLGERANGLIASYASNLEGFIMDRQPRFWLHGHTHNDVDYMIGETRIIANMRGYVRKHSDFKPLIFDLE